MTQAGLPGNGLHWEVSWVSAGLPFPDLYALLHLAAVKCSDAPNP